MLKKQKTKFLKKLKTNKFEIIYKPWFKVGCKVATTKESIS